MGWKSKKRKKKRKKKLYLQQIRQELKYLQIVNKLPEDLVKVILKYLDLRVLNIISPLKYIKDIYFLTSSNYWLNFYLYFWYNFNHNTDEHKYEIKKYYKNIKKIKYIQYRKKIYNINESRFIKLMIKYVKKDVAKYKYGDDQEIENINNRLKIEQSDEEILKIIN